MTMLLIFDTETTDIPVKNEPASSPNQPRIVQLAAQMCDHEGNVKAELNVIIKPDGWELTPKIAAIHGITTEMAALYGVPIAEAMRLFWLLIKRPGTVVGHNVQFDLFMVRSELFRLGVDAHKIAAVTENRSIACTQVMATDVMKLPPTENQRKYGFAHKPPKLAEAYHHFTGREASGAHNAMNDVRYCKAVYFAIMKTRENTHAA